MESATITPPAIPFYGDTEVDGVCVNTEISDGKKGLYELLQRNKEWAKSVIDETPHFFEKLSGQQTPEILWIGCADARVPPNQILNLKPGEVITHSNLANEVVHSDLNCLSVIEYAVTQLKVKHIIVCGHYGCSGIKAALSQTEHGLVDNWLRNIKDLYIEQRKKFHSLSNEEMEDLLTEENVVKSVFNVCHTRIVQNAWKSGQPLSVHGWCYSINDGLIHDLNLCLSSESQVEPIYRQILETRASISTTTPSNIPLKRPSISSLQHDSHITKVSETLSSSALPVVLSAALLSKNGKVMVARQFVEVSRIRLEGLLTAFPKLLASESRQHTFIDTESVRYVYQPIESFFLLLITNKTSNIVEDLYTMQLMAKLVPDICGQLTEAHIREKQFDLVFGFDELLTAGGHAEQINLQQIRTNLEMESHEEKLHLMIQKTKLENATADRKRQEQRIKEEQREKARQERAAGISIKTPSSYSGFGSGGGFSSPTSSSYSSQTSAPRDTYVEPPKPALSVSSSKTLGMKLGGSKKGSSFLDAMAAEDGLKDIPPVAIAASSIPAPSDKPEPAAAVSSDPVGLAIEEKITVQLNRDGALEQLEVKGSFFVAGNDPESSACRLHLRHSNANGVNFQTHPKVDKKLFESQSILALKDDTKPFPPSRVAVLRWAIKTQDESALPLNITCWPEEESNGKMTVNLEYSMDREMHLENVVIQIPTGVVDPPHISHIDGEYRHNPSDNCVLWRLPSITPENNTGSLEFTIRGTNLDAYFPIQVSFYSRTTYSDLVVDRVLKTTDQSPVQYGFDRLISTESYVVQ